MNATSPHDGIASAPADDSRCSDLAAELHVAPLNCFMRAA